MNPTPIKNPGPVSFLLGACTGALIFGVGSCSRSMDRVHHETVVYGDLDCSPHGGAQVYSEGVPTELKFTIVTYCTDGTWVTRLDVPSKQDQKSGRVKIEPVKESP